MAAMSWLAANAQLWEAMTRGLDRSKPAYAWRMLRWEADIPLSDEQRTELLSALPDAMAAAGSCTAALNADGDQLFVLVGAVHFPAPAHRETVMWLCAHRLIELLATDFGQEGLLSVGAEADTPEEAAAGLDAAQELSDWWNSVTPIPPQAAHRHRTQLQMAIKRRQFGMLGGYATRALRGEVEISRTCFAFVPMVIEAIWAQHGELSLQHLTTDLNLNEMTRKPKEALLKWMSRLDGLLRSSPTMTTTEPIDRVVAGIQADCSLPYTQANLSRSLGLTPAYFCRLFHEKTGRHFSSFLTQTRMEKAQRLLREQPSIPLQELSVACGYPNKSYFCQVFKKYTGMTPGEFAERFSTRKQGEN